MPETVSEVDGGAYLATFEFTRNLLAACPSVVLDALGVADAADAKQKIYYQETLAEDDDEEEGDSEGDPPPELEPRPYAIVVDGPRNRRLAGVGEWSGEGQVIVVFEVLVPIEFAVDRQVDDSATRRDKFRRRKRWAMALVGRIEDEITENSGSADEEGNEYLNVVDLELAVPPADPAESQAEDFIGFAFSLRWK